MISVEVYLIQIGFAILIILIACIIVYRLANVRKKLRNERCISCSSKAKLHCKTVALEHFGVRWNALVGSLLRGKWINGEYYVYVEGLFCSNCGVELVLRNISKWKGLSYKQVWQCPKFDKSYERPKLYLHEEDKIIEKLVKAQL